MGEVSRRARKAREEENLAKPWNWRGNIALLFLYNSPTGVISGSEA